MLLKYFGLEDDPFGVTPEPRCLFESRTHREALASLKYAFYSNRGFTALIARPGMGKTTLLYRFLNEIRDSARSVFLFDLDMQCEPRELIGYILRDLGLAPAGSSAEMHGQLNDLLVTEARAGRRVVIVIDEAQNLSEPVLETVRLLSNFETPRAKLLQIVLAGQPQLAEKLVLPSLTQLRQRISTICRIEPLSPAETRAYIEHRLKLSGYSGPQLFSDAALTHIAVASQGTPRIINNLCFNSLSLCRAMNTRQVSSAMIEEVLADQKLVPEPEKAPEPAPAPAIAPKAEPTYEPESEDESERKKPERRWIAIAAALAVAAVAGLAWFASSGGLQPNRGTASHPAVASRAPAAPEATPQASEAGKASPGFSMPKAPFEITIEPHQTLKDITVKYFGDFSPARLHQIQALNPTITNPDHIEAGQTIWLPGSATATFDQNAAPAPSARNLP